MKKRSNVTSVLPPQKWGASTCVLSRLGPLQKTGAVVTTSSEMKIYLLSLCHLGASKAGRGCFGQ